MGPTASQVKDIITGMRSRGLQVGLRDVSFSVLTNIYGDEALAFRSVFGDEPDIPRNEYITQEKIVELLKEVEPLFKEDNVTFDELKAGLINDLRALEKVRDQTNEDGNSLLDAKEMATVTARIADIRVKLTEKFNTTERVVEQRVVVEQKFNSVCPSCGREISIQQGPQLKPNGTLF